MLFCSCTTTTLIPSVATWLSGQLGIFQTHASFDLVAACAGFPYGLSEATRLLQEVERPVLIVCAEKFSDKIGAVRTSRMIFGDGASALVVGPAEAGGAGDVDVLQSYAGGPASEVNSIIWPNPRVRQRQLGLRPRGPLPRANPLPRTNDRGAAGPAASRRRGRLAARRDRPRRAAPGEQDDGDRARVRCRADARPALLPTSSASAASRRRASRSRSTRSPTA